MKFVTALALTAMLSVSAFSTSASAFYSRDWRGGYAYGTAAGEYPFSKYDTCWKLRALGEMRPNSFDHCEVQGAESEGY